MVTVVLGHVESEIRQTLGRPTVECVPLRARSPLGGLAHHKDPVFGQKAAATFCGDCRRAERAGHHRSVGAAMSRVSPEILGAAPHNLSARLRPEATDRPLQEPDTALRSVQQRH